MRTKYIDTTTYNADKLQTMKFNQAGAGQGLPEEMGLNQYITAAQENNKGLQHNK